MSHSPFGILLRQLTDSANEAACAESSDGHLLERFVTHRDEAAFADLLRRHGPMVLSVCRRALVNEQDREDVFQATFLLLACKAGSIRKREGDSAAAAPLGMSPALLFRRMVGPWPPAVGPTPASASGTWLREKCCGSLKP